MLRVCFVNNSEFFYKDSYSFVVLLLSVGFTIKKAAIILKKTITVFVVLLMVQAVDRSPRAWLSPGVILIT